MKSLIHHSAIVDDGAEIGKNTKIWHWTHISSGAKIGCNCSLGQNVFLGNKTLVGNNVKIQNNVSVYKGVMIESYVFVGPSVVFTNVIMPRSFINQKKKFIKTILKKGCSIGANSTIICGNNVGKYAFVGAGSLVTKSVNDFKFGFGVPLEIKGSVSKNGKLIYENTN